MRHRLLPTAGIAALSVVALAACSGSPSAAPGKVSTEGLATAKSQVAQYLKPPTTITQTVPLATKAPSGKSIVYLIQKGVPSAARVATGVEQAAQAVGWTFSEVNYDPASPASLQAAFSTALLKHPTAVGVTGSNPSTFGASTIAEYKKAGVPIIVTDVGKFDDQDGEILGDPGGLPSLEQEANVLAAWFVADSGGKGQALWASQSSFSSMESLHSYFMDAVDKLCSACNVRTVDLTVGQLESGAEPSVVVSQLRQHPELKYLLFDDGSFAAGIGSALSSAGLTDVKVAGCDVQAEQIAALKAGTQAAWTGVDTQLSGLGIMDIALRYVEKMSPTAKDDLRPTQLLTKDNIGDPGDAWSVPFPVLDQYKKLWGVG